MALFFETLVAGTAYSGFVLCLAALSSGAFSAMPVSLQRRRNARTPGLFNSLAGLCALGSFLFLPAGTLPPIINVAFGAPFAFGMLLLALILLASATRYAAGAARQAIPRGIAPLAAVICLFAWIARSRGLPGEIFNAATFTAVPLWTIMGGPGKIGLAALAAGSVLAVSGVFSERSDFPIARRILRLSAAQLFVSLLFPVTPSRLLFSDMPSYAPAMDFAGNWVLVLALAQKIFPVAGRHAGNRALSWFLLLSGCAFCVADTLWG